MSRQSFEQPLSTDDYTRIDATFRPIVARRRDGLRAPIVDPDERTLRFFCWEGIAGALLGILALPALWLVLTIVVMIAG